MNTNKVNRVEIIDWTKNGKGRAYVKWEKELDVELQLQDRDRTLKIFIKDI